MRVINASENSLIVYLGEQATQEVSEKIYYLADELEKVLTIDLIDLIPSYASLLVIFNPLTTDHFSVRNTIFSINWEMRSNTKKRRETITLPVYYDEEVGNDLNNLAEKKRLAVDEVIELHTGVSYLVYAIGFAPGFAYLGEVDEKIAAQRLSTPRMNVPRGSVAIADRQTAVYPASSPGGWNLIGRCPIKMYDPTTSPYMLVGIGDTVRFEAIDRKKFLSLGGEL